MRQLGQVLRGETGDSLVRVSEEIGIQRNIWHYESRFPNTEVENRRLP